MSFATSNGFVSLPINAGLSAVIHVQVSLNYWMLWSALMVGMGAGFTMLNNLGQMVEALGGRREGQGIYVLLFTTLNTVGRMVGGYVPEKLLHARGTPRFVQSTAQRLLSPFGLLPLEHM